MVKHIREYKARNGIFHNGPGDFFCSNSAMRLRLVFKSGLSMTLSTSSLKILPTSGPAESPRVSITVLPWIYRFSLMKSVSIPIYVELKNAQNKNQSRSGQTLQSNWLRQNKAISFACQPYTDEEELEAKARAKKR